MWEPEETAGLHLRKWNKGATFSVSPAAIIPDPEGVGNPEVWVGTSPEKHWEVEQRAHFPVLPFLQWVLALGTNSGKMASP